jgi:3-oxoacyl-[acyl-carrier protein] reductase
MIDPLLDFTGKRVLVVGGSSGIGNGIAQAFRARGADVLVWGTRGAAADYDASEGSDLAGLGYTQVDASNAESIAAAPDPFAQGLDILVHSQGAVVYKRQEFQRATFDSVVAVNLSSVMQISERFQPALAKRKGAVIVVSSIGAYKATIANPAYAASKAGAVQLVKALALAWAGEGIRVNGIAPGLVDTRMTKVTTEHPERRERALAKVPLNRFGTTDDMAGIALFLASPMSGFVTGQTIIADGGVTL